MWLDVPYADKDTAKALGARWDGAARRWFALPGRVNQLTAWAAAPALPDPLPGEDRAFGDGLFVDSIPTSCWFTNMRTCVSPSDRAQVKTLVVGRTGRRCEVCGTGAEHLARAVAAGARTLVLQRHDPGTDPAAARVPVHPLPPHDALRVRRGHRTPPIDARAPAVGQPVECRRRRRPHRHGRQDVAAAGVVPSPAPSAADRRAITEDTLDRTIHHTP